LVETIEFLNSFHLTKVKAFKCFDPEGIFSSHLSSIGYGAYFVRMQEIIEGVVDNNPNTRREISKKEKQVYNDDLVTKVSSNTQVKKNKLNKECKQAKHK
jgi:hypothetical protein